MRRSGRPREALALYEKALPAFEAQYGRNGSALVDVLLGLGEAQLEVRTSPALARRTRTQLAALSFSTDTLLQIDRWLADK